MGNLIEIRIQLEKLQKQAVEIKSRESNKTVKRILVAMDAFDVALRDLLQASGNALCRSVAKKGKAARPAAKKVAAGKAARSSSVPKLAAKYPDFKGEVWNDRGSMPRWIAELVVAGKSRENYAV